MTTTIPAVRQATTITMDLQRRVSAINDYLNLHIVERPEVIRGVIVARIAQLHALMIGPGGTGKSYLQRSLVQHISGAKLFEVAFDETTDPAQVFGPVDIKAMAEDGKMRRIPTGMLPEATEAFLDEFYNGNTPLLHSVMPPLNERIWHNNGMPIQIPLRQAVMGTNKLNLDADLAALGDRVHLKFEVRYIQSRDNRIQMIHQAIDRMRAAGKRGTVGIDVEKPMVTVEELDQAFTEALGLHIPESIDQLFCDIREEITHQGVTLSDRRDTEAYAAILANAWFRGHDVVQPVDLDILQHMWWTNLEETPIARKVVLEATNPGEKAAMDLLDALDDLKMEYRKITSNKDLDKELKKRQSMETMKNIEKLLREAGEAREKQVASGMPTARIDDLMGRSQSFKADVARETFGVAV